MLCFAAMTMVLASCTESLLDCVDCEGRLSGNLTIQIGVSNGIILTRSEECEQIEFLSIYLFGTNGLKYYADKYLAKGPDQNGKVSYYTTIEVAPGEYRLYAVANYRGLTGEETES